MTWYLWRVLLVVYLLGICVYPIMRLFWFSRILTSPRPPSIWLHIMTRGPIWPIVMLWDVVPRLLKLIVTAPFILIAKAKERNYRR